MQYLGGKTRISKEILPVLTLDFGSEFKTYIEPFVGGCGMLKSIPLFNDVKVIGYDKNPFLIALLNHAKTVVNGETVPHYVLPPELGDLIGRDISKEDYKTYRSIAKLPPEERKWLGVPDELLGYAGFIYSFRGDFFQGYNGNGKDAMKSIESFLRTVQQLQGKTLMCSSYESITLPDEPCIIYCDPPYIGERYVGQCFKAHWLELMDYELFYNVLRYWRSLGHRILLSERVAPPDFEVVWGKDVNISMGYGADNRNAGLGVYVKEDKVKSELLFALP